MDRDRAQMGTLNDSAGEGRGQDAGLVSRRWLLVQPLSASKPGPGLVQSAGLLPKGCRAAPVSRSWDTRDTARWSRHMAQERWRRCRGRTAPQAGATTAVTCKRARSPPPAETWGTWESSAHGGPEGHGHQAQAAGPPAASPRWTQVIREGPATPSMLCDLLW